MALKQIRETQDEQMNKKLERVEGKALECERNIEELDTLEQEINNLLVTQEENIDKQAELAIARINDLAEYMKESIRQNEENRIQGIQAEKIHQEKLAQEIRNAGSNVRNTLQGTPSKAYTRAINRFDEELEEVLAMDINGFCRNPAEGMLRCHMETYISVLPGNLIHVRPCQLELKFELGNFKDASAIASTSHNYLAVSDFGRKVVTIIRKKPGGKCKRKRNLRLVNYNTTYPPHDVAVRSEGEFLVARVSHVEVYTAQGKYRGIVKYGLSTEKIKEELEEKSDLSYGDIHKETVRAHRIAVTDNDTILIADFNNSSIHIFPSDLDQNNQKLTTTIDPYRLAVCPGGHIGIMQRDKIGIMNLKSGEEIRNFDIPRALGFCYHKPSDCFLIGRHVQEDNMWTGVIEQYCTMTGRFIARLADGLCNPQDMVVTPDGQLAIADGKSVKIYKVTLQWTDTC